MTSKKNKKSLIFRLFLIKVTVFIICAVMVISCSNIILSTSLVTSEYIELLPATAKNMTVKKQQGDYHYFITTTANDPNVQTRRLAKVNPSDAVVLTFEYKSSKNLDFIQIFFSTPISETRSFKTEAIPASENWKSWSVVLKKTLSSITWGSIGHYLRLDFGDNAGYSMELRNMHFRNMTIGEIEQENQEQEKLENINRLDKNLKDYLSADFYSSVIEVNAEETTITVKGNYTGNGNYSLCEIPPYMNVTEINQIKFNKNLITSPFTEVFDRYVLRNDILYDRTLSKWVIVKEEHGEQKSEIASHARYADNISSSQVTIAEKPANKKGIGDCQNNTTMIQDIDDLGITSATINIRITTFMYSKPGNNRIEHIYGGKSYYFDKNHVENLDKTLIACRDRNIVVSAIILINNIVTSCDPAIGHLLQHPDYTSSGNYSMPNMTNPESVNTYAAALDFLAARYCRVDKQYGRIHHWIMHNEVDSGFEWTNMGSDKPMNVYMDTYIKSMRICYNIIRRYDTHSEVFVSHTHAWAERANNITYASLDMLNTLNAYCKVEGDFQWGLAFHCYPYDLHEPKTWLDEKATYSPNSPIITYKNLEVLDYWTKQSENKYKGSFKRTVWLSENGTNSRTYSVKDIEEQAAGFVWGWKKLNNLDGIDAHQWHNWADHEAEYGLRIGLRRFPANGLERKEVWFVYKAAGTPAENDVFSKYLPIIGISDWNILKPIDK